MKQLRAWLGIRRLKQRRVEEADTELRSAKSEMAEARSALDRALEQMNLREVENQRCRQGLRDLLDGAKTFTTSLVQHRIEQVRNSEAMLVEARSAADLAGKKLAACEQKVASARRVLDRRRQQLEKLDEEIQRRRAMAEEEVANQEDEDAEESAVARLLTVVQSQEAEQRGRL